MPYEVTWQRRAWGNVLRQCLCHKNPLYFVGCPVRLGNHQLYYVWTLMVISSIVIVEMFMLSQIVFKSVFTHIFLVYIDTYMLYFIFHICVISLLKWFSIFTNIIFPSSIH